MPATPPLPVLASRFTFTEGGSLTPGGTTGSVTGSVLERLSQIASVTVGGQPATVTFAGAAPYFVDGVANSIFSLRLIRPRGQLSLSSSQSGLIAAQARRPLPCASRKLECSEGSGPARETDSLND